jgi:hypothetical protein
MTDRDHITWDLTEQAIRGALEMVQELHGTLGAMQTTAAANRLLMTMSVLDEAIDYMSAARARMPNPE